VVVVFVVILKVVNYFFEGI